ncbi:MAG: hypothetical protein ACJ8AT_33550 [Hyalangium sp.]|uniref:hypothetical protein n=1 Tax=Hyalangium sp. TaxID=2028555 RepID=UPI003899C654
MPSARDTCFAEAVDAYNALQKEATGRQWLDISHQTPWVRDAGAGTPWHPIEGYVSQKWFHIYGYIKSKFGYSMGQVRYPDITLKQPNGKYIVLDNKFSGDDWGKAQNRFSGTTQRKDYEQINQERGHGNLGEPSLNPKKCNCDERKKKKELRPQSVPVPVRSPATNLNPYLLPSPLAPGVSPGGVTIPAPRLPVFEPLVPAF